MNYIKIIQIFVLLIMVGSWRGESSQSQGITCDYTNSNTSSKPYIQSIPSYTKDSLDFNNGVSKIPNKFSELSINLQSCLKAILPGEIDEALREEKNKEGNNIVEDKISLENFYKVVNTAKTYIRKRQSNVPPNKPSFYETISKWFHKKRVEEEIRNIMHELREDHHKNWKYFQEWDFDEWPEQDHVSALLGYLFFPSELENLYDSEASIYSRPAVRLALAYSAKENNLLALYHLVNMIHHDIEVARAFCDDSSDEEMEGVEMGENMDNTYECKELLTNRESIKESSVLLNEIVEEIDRRIQLYDSTVQLKESFFHMENLKYLFYHSSFCKKNLLESCLETIKKNIEMCAKNHNDVRAKYWLAINTEYSKSIKNNYIIEAKNHGYIKAKLKLLKYCDNQIDKLKPADRIIYYYNFSREHNNPEGYYKAYILVQARVINKKMWDDLIFPYLKSKLEQLGNVSNLDKVSIFLLEQAGKLGMIKAYDEAIEILKYYMKALYSTTEILKDPVLNKIKFLYEDKGNKGDPKGYYDLGKLYKSLREYDKAKEYFKKAGPIFDNSEVCLEKFYGSEYLLTQQSLQELIGIANPKLNSVQENNND